MYLSKLHSIGSKYSYKLHQLNQLHSFRSHVLHLSTLSKPSKLSKSKKTREIPVKNDTERKSFASLLSEITEILGSSNLNQDKISYGFSKSNKTELMIKDPSCTQHACGNDQENMDEKQALDNLSEHDVSPIVHEITEIVRAENTSVSMEEKLEKSGLLFDADIVEKVLKRCFKVPHLAFRFFNWVKYKDGFCHTTSTFNTMLSIAGEAKEYWLVDKLLDKMETNTCKRDIKTWTILISLYGKTKSISKALMIFEEMKKSGCEPDSKTYRMMVRLLCNAQKSDLAMEFYKEMVQQEWGLDINSYKLLLNCLTKSGDISTVYLIADDMIKISRIPEQNVYACLLKSFCISGKIREALELIRDFKKKKLTVDPDNFETLVKGLCKADRIDEALEIVQIMMKKHVVNGKIYEILVNGYLRKNNINKAFHLFQTMKDSGISPTTFTYTELMQHFFKWNEYHKGCELYHEMLEKGVEIDSVAMTAIVAGHVTQNRVLEAWQVFKDMEEKGIKATQKFYFIFIKELGKIRKTEEIFKVLNKMRSSKLIIDDDLFHWVISYLGNNGETGMVEKVKEMQRTCKLNPHGGEKETSTIDARGGEKETFSIDARGGEKEIFSIDARGGEKETFSIDARDARGGEKEIFSIDARGGEKETFSIDARGGEKETSAIDAQTNELNIEVQPDLVQPNFKAYNEQDLQEICKILSSTKEWCVIEKDLEKSSVKFTHELVVEILRRSALHGALMFFSWLGKRSGYFHSMETYHMAIKIAGSGKDFKHMRNIFFEMRRNGCEIVSDTWTIMIMQYGRAGLTEIALRNFLEMKNEGIIKPNYSTYKYLIIFLCGKKGRRVDEAIKIFGEMLRVGHIPDKELIEIYFNCLCEDNKLSEVKKCAKSLFENGVFSIPLCYSMYARALCRVGKLEEVFELLNEAGTESDRLKLDQYIYGSLVHGLLRKGRLNDALEKVNSMKKLGTYPSVHVYTSFIVHFFKEKKIEKALEMFKKMQEEGCEPNIVTYSALIRGFMDTGNFVEAWNVFYRIKLKGPMPDFKMYSMFIEALCKVGKSEEALQQLIPEMLDIGMVPSTVNFQCLIYGLNREGKRDLARDVLQRKVDLKNKRKLLP